MSKIKDAAFHLHDARGRLPAHSYKVTFSNVIEIEDTWLAAARPEQQIDALKAWFTSRHYDPTEEEATFGELPEDYINGIVDPAVALTVRFAEVVPPSLIERAAAEIEVAGGERWSALLVPEDEDGEFFYDEEFAVEVAQRNDPGDAFEQRLTEIRYLINTSEGGRAESVALKFGYSGVITAIESYLWETMVFAVDNLDSCIPSIIKNVPYFKGQQFTLDQVFDVHKGLKERVKGYFQTIVWHNWTQVMPLLAHGLGKRPPKSSFLRDAALKRHDIIHRSGHTLDGTPINLTRDEVFELMEHAHQFVDAIERNVLDAISATLVSVPPPNADTNEF
jgi:hypothetical protein